MGTANFYNKNASHTFVRELETEFDYDMFKEDIYHTFKHHNYHVFNGKNYRRPESDLRSFPSIIVASKSKYKIYNDVELIITINVILRSGYYQHANLDWELAKELPVLSDYYYNIGLAKIHEPYAELWAENAENELIEETEKIFKDLTEPYNVSARFSNGEAFYTKA